MVASEEFSSVIVTPARASTAWCSPSRQVRSGQRRPVNSSTIIDLVLRRRRSAHRAGADAATWSACSTYCGQRRRSCGSTSSVSWSSARRSPSGVSVRRCGARVAREIARRLATRRGDRGRRGGRFPACALGRRAPVAMMSGLRASSMSTLSASSMTAKAWPRWTSVGLRRRAAEQDFVEARLGCGRRRGWRAGRAGSRSRTPCRRRRSRRTRRRRVCRGRGCAFARAGRRSGRAAQRPGAANSQSRSAR